jgi:hypothetical protein
MLLMLAESALAGYLAVVHREAGGPAEPASAWRGEVVAAIAARREELAALWLGARSARDEEGITRELAQVLGDAARGLLGRV